MASVAIEPDKMLAILNGIASRRERTEAMRAAVLAVVSVLWHGKCAGDLSDIATAVRGLEPFREQHEFQLRPDVRAALRWLQRRGRVRFVRKRGWVPA